MAELDLTLDVVSLTAALVDIGSVSHEEQEIADAVESALRGYDHLEVTRRGHTVVARTTLGHAERVVIAGHLDTVPVNDNAGARIEGDVMHGLGTCDMKGGDAVILKLAADLRAPNRDLTFVLYEAEAPRQASRSAALIAKTSRPSKRMSPCLTRAAASKMPMIV